MAKLGWSLTMPPKISPALDKALTRDARVLSLVRRAAHMPNNFPALKFKKGMEIAEDARDRRNTRVKDLARLLTSSGVSYLSHGRKHEAVARGATTFSRYTAKM